MCRVNPLISAAQLLHFQFQPRTLTRRQFFVLTPTRRFGLVGALVAGASAFVLWACVPVPGQNVSNPPNNGNSTTQASQKGDVKVSIQLPSDTRQTQSVLDTLGSVSLSISGVNIPRALTADFTKAQLAGGSATRTFEGVPAGPATVTATARNTVNAVMSTSTSSIEVVAGSTVYASMKLTLTDNAGVVSTTIEIAIVEPGSNLVIGQIDDKQRGAQYVGQDTCIMCHSGIGDAFKGTAHYKGVRDSAGNIRYPAKGRQSCATCHATGANALALYGTETPFDFVTKGATDSPNHLVSTITCEACHGPGSKHVVATYEDRFKTITRRPSHSDTCVTCHSGYLKKYDADGKPVYDSGTNQVYEPAKFGPTGATEEAVMAGGGHNALGMGPVASVINQTGGWTNGVAPTFTNAHQTKVENGCVGCHMANPGADKHTFAITEHATASTITNSCQKCHGTGFTAESITSYQAQTKLALARMKDALVAFRQAFATKYYKKPRNGAPSETTDPAAASDLTYVPSMWVDSDDYVKNATASAPTNFTDKANWTDGNNHWSYYQKVYNRAYWNYSLANGEASFGIHAPTYTQTLLRTSYNSLVNEFIAANKPASASFSLMSLK